MNVKKALLTARSLTRQGDLNAASSLYKSILADYPQNKQAAQGLASLGLGGPIAAKRGMQPTQAQIEQLISLFNAGHLQPALEQGQLLAAKCPEDPLIQNLLGAVYTRLGQPEDAIANFTRAILIKPDYAEAYNNLGAAFNEAGKYSEAIDSYTEAIKLEPGNADAHFNLGNTLRDAGRLEEATLSYISATQLGTGQAQAYNNLGIVFNDLGRRKEAITSYTRAIALKPDFASAHRNLGNAYTELGRIEEAIASYTMAIQLAPTYAEVHKSLGGNLAAVGRLPESIASYATALRYQPDNVAAKAEMLHQLANTCDWGAIQSEAASIPHLGLSEDDVGPFTLLSLEDHPIRHHARSELHARKMYPYEELPAILAPEVKPERLRIGYFSADFKLHPVALLTARLFELHDRRHFTLFAFSSRASEKSEFRERLENGFDTYIDVTDLSDKNVAQLAREHQIDIAVDLTGYTANNRTGIFAYRTAPIQINYLGYPGTMGATFMDYIIADRVLIPEEQQECYSEKIIFLPDTYMVSDNTRIISEDALTRASLGLPESGFVFCSFNNAYKISPTEFDIWMRILLKVDDSVLWLLKSNPWVAKNLIKEARMRGVDPERLIFAERAPYPDYLARLGMADLFLDTFVYGAGATANDALWAGLPVLSCMGEGYVTRMAGSLLHAIDLPELVAASAEEYEALAIDLALNPGQLAALKEKLAVNRLATAVFDTERFARHIEDAYQQVYQRYFEGKPPATLLIQS